LSRRDHREETTQFSLIGLTAIFAYFKRLGILNCSSLIPAIPFFKRCPDLLGDSAFPLCCEPFLSLAWISGDFIKICNDPAKPLKELRRMGIHSMDLLQKDRGYVDGDIGAKRIGALEVILEIEEHGILFKRRRVSGHVGNGHHIRSILNKYSRIPVIGVVIVGPRCDHYVGIPFADLANDLQPDVQSMQQGAIMIVEFLVLYPEALSGLLRHCPPSLSKNASALRLMAGVTVGH